MDYRKAYIRAVRGEELPDGAYWKALGLIVSTGAESLAGKFGKPLPEVLADMAAWAEVEADGDGDGPCE